jgi:hypothetical protein
MTHRLESLDLGFREQFLDYEALTTQLRSWAEAFPDVARLTSLGTTPGGRELWMLTLGRDPDRLRPALWVDGNMHAVELCGSSVALAFAETLIRLHRGESVDQPDHITAFLRESLVYVLPRMSPDGAERVLDDGAYVRSVPRDERPHQLHPHWVSADQDGDGLSLLMRVEDPSGEFVASTEVPGLLLPRRIEDSGPFYKVYPEGVIENFDGHNIPDPDFLSDNQTDLNRNFPWSWAPPHVQVGAGAHPLSEVESQAVVAFTTANPHIFGWVNFHTFGGVFIRPHGGKPDNQMDASDLALYRQLGAWATELTGYPMVSGFEEFTYTPDTPIRGDVTDFAYHQLGCVTWACELWDLFHQIGIERKKRFVDHYTHVTRDELIALGRWDAEHNQGRVVRPWRPFVHPQLGEVEVGGVDPRFGLWNPPFEQLAELCEQHVAMLLKTLAIAPRLVLEPPVVEAVSPGTWTVSVTVRNEGYLPTYVLSSAKKLAHNEPLYAVVRASGCRLADASQTRREVGHLEGWGRGLFSGDGALYFMRSKGSVSARTLVWTVRGEGTLEVAFRSCRTGEVGCTVEVG